MNEKSLGRFVHVIEDLRLGLLIGLGTARKKISAESLE